MRNIVLRLGKEENALRLSAPYYSSMERIDKMVSEFLPKLIKRSKKVDAALPYGDGWVYILGERIEAEFEDEKEREMYLKKRLLKVVEERVRLYEKEMGVFPPYKVRVEKMSSRYGPNSRKTHSLCFASVLIHYPIEIIDSVVVHELAHHYVFDHSQKFYNVVLKYCPEYKRLHTRLRKKMYE
jgi:predicted metal-dependent hydrolase